MLRAQTVKMAGERKLGSVPDPKGQRQVGQLSHNNTFSGKVVNTCYSQLLASRLDRRGSSSPSPHLVQNILLLTLHH
ncbi:hypothetical protein Cadr_000021077 [Camelus dromedarius]|uniref:Uncharacterized protein n=1 Tax=Camelus dromedarius TaxID=9838 RepID=A0A5N4CTN4_CAMDR|nr:hypothetical protein Cadr_000021077 [Camelus dromedarius]